MRNDVTAVQWAGAVAQTGPAQIFTVPGPRDHEGQKQKEPKKKKKKELVEIRDGDLPFLQGRRQMKTSTNSYQAPSGVFMYSNVAGGLPSSFAHSCGCAWTLDTTFNAVDRLHNTDFTGSSILHLHMGSNRKPQAMLKPAVKWTCRLRQSSLK